MKMDTLDIHPWADLARRLSRVLEHMAEDEFLVICIKRSNRFVQFACQGAHGVRAEATSNVYLKGQDKLDLSDIEKLTALGWKPPTGSPAQSTPGNDPVGSPNYFRDFAAGSDTTQIAELAVRTLREAFDAASPIFLEYEAFDEDGNQTTHAELGLRRALRDPQNSAIDRPCWNCTRFIAMVELLVGTGPHPALTPSQILRQLAEVRR